MSARHDIAAAWTRIERVLQKHVPETAGTLASPATDRQIVELEDALSLRLPEEFRRSLRIHNGQDDPHGTHSFVIEGTLANTAGIAEQWKMLTEVDEHLRRQYPDWDNDLHQEWWSPSWVPFTQGSGDCLCINLNPLVRPGGSSGEVVCHLLSNPHEPGIAPSYGAWLEAVASRLENGEFTVEDGKLWPNIA